MDFVTVSTGLILPYWMGLPIRYIHNVYEDIPLIQNFILDYYTETNNKDMMIKILIDIKSFNDKDLTLKSSTLFVDSSS